MTWPDRLSPSFRDPGGSVVSINDRILRVVRRTSEADVLQFLSSTLGASLVSDELLVRSRIVNAQGSESDVEPWIRAKLEEFGGGTLLEHERVPFVSFPYEWAPEMLYAAATLTLDLAERCLHGDFGLKDATPYNVLFRGTRPVFIDLLSFERRTAGDPVWLPYAQFVRTFLLPLAMSKYYGMRLDAMLITRRDGLEPEEIYRLLKLRHRIQPTFMKLVCIPKWLGRVADKNDSAIYQKKILKDPEKAVFILDSVFAGLRRSLDQVKPVFGKTSVWSGYREGVNSYSSGQFAAKQAFVDWVMREYRPKRVLDIGCNTGHFSMLAARTGAAVVAIDQDPVVVGETWRVADAAGASVLPLVVDICRPTPAVGWVNRECLSFLDRARGSFDAVLMLAVLHHMLITERIPLDNIFNLAANLTKDLLVIEFVGPEDRMFRKLLRGRDELHRDVTADVFESRCSVRFDILRRQRLEGTDRCMYLLRRKT